MLEVLHASERIFGAWGENRVILFTKITLDITVGLYFVIGMVLYTLNLFSDPTTTNADITDAMYTLQSTANLFYDYVCRTILRKSLLKFFRNVEAIVVFKAPAAMCDVNAQINRNVKIAVIYSIVVPFSIIMLSYATSKWYSTLYHKIARTHYKGFPYGIYYPYNYSQGPSFVIHAIITTYAYLILFTNTFLYICSSYTAVECIVMKIEHLKMMLAEVMDLEAKTKLEQLKKCVKYHIHIISLVEDFNSCYNAVTTPAPFFYGSILGTVLYSLTEEVRIKAAALAVTFVAIIFTLCRVGQRLIDKSESIAVAAYDVNWYDMNVEARKYIQLMMIRSQRPLKYDAGPFGIFSLLLFATILRCAYTYLTMQSNFKEE